jgi:hypothetical protein
MKIDKFYLANPIASNSNSGEQLILQSRLKCEDSFAGGEFPSCRISAKFEPNRPFQFDQKRVKGYRVL